MPVELTDPPPLRSAGVEQSATDGLNIQNTWRDLASCTAILGIAAVLRLWNLSSGGFGNPYYAASVRSMLVSSSNFWYGAFDPAGFITVDKPPVALWVQGVSAKLFGYSGYSLLLPQALMGVLNVAVLYVIIRRSFGTMAASVAAFCLAVTPITVAVDRGNLPDPLLTLLLTLAAGALLRALEAGSLRWLSLSVTIVGVAFNVKMLAAFVVLPVFYLVYLLYAQNPWKNRFVQLTLATVLLFAVSLSWSIAVELAPPDQRPYIGGSENNSAISLALGYNGLSRVFGGLGMPGRSGTGSATAAAKTVHESGPATRISSGANPLAGSGPRQGLPGGPGLPAGPGFPGGPGIGFGGGGGRGGPGGMFGGTPGLGRFANPVMAEQITWLFPMAILGAVSALCQTVPGSSGSRRRAAVLLWFGWLAIHGVVFSFAQGIFHEYYTTVMGPAVAALVGLGIPALWGFRHAPDWRRSLLPTALLLTACWQASIMNRYAAFQYRLVPIVLGVLFAGVALLVYSHWLTRIVSKAATSRLSSIGASVALLAVFIGPVIWSLGSTLGTVNAMLPTADVSVFTGTPGNRMPFPMPEANVADTEKLIEYLRSQRTNEKYLVASSSSMEVSPIIIQSGDTAISLGGFMGADPVLTKDDFTRLVEHGDLRFVLVGGGLFGGGMPSGGPPGRGLLGLLGGGPPGMPRGGLPGMPASGPPGIGGGGPPGMPMQSGTADIVAWVRKHGVVVDESLWRDAATESETRGGFGPFGGLRQLYDLKPALRTIRK